MCRNSFRVRPWFAPGVWGGTYLRDSIEGLNKDEKNLAWSFELMALENGIMFQHDNVLMETSFSFLMSYGYKEILGDCAEDFKEDFPIRFDFLDTINGDNLSIQCHPRPEYIRSRFGKTYTQDETYYILRCTPDATVYLGFQEGVRKDEFSKALNWSQDNAEKLNITDYVQSFEAKKHDLFLIPNGTIHASGAGNLVLEISSAPYIFTFKMYDWVRLDIDGRPRPINIEHGLNNVRFERNGDVVKETLISKPYVMEKTDSLQIEHVPTHPDHFYDVHRYTLSSGTSIKIDNNDKCHVWMIVEGSHVELETAGGMKETYNYIETFIVPAATEHYTLTNTSDNDVMLVKAFVKDNYTL
jgi:mannose-6-phosphate isomerase class I